MSSPIHKFLFSPPSSPPRSLSEDKIRRPSFTPLQTILPGVELTFGDHNAAPVKAASAPCSPKQSFRSPATTPKQSTFTLDSIFPTSLTPRTSTSSRPPSIILTYEDIQSTPQIDMTPRQRSRPNSAPNSPHLLGEMEGKLQYPSSPRLSSSTLNVPSTPIPKQRQVLLSPALPKPLLRLLLLGSLLMTCVMMMIWIPSARLPSLRTATTARRLALASDGKAIYEAYNPVQSWDDAAARDYVPPKVRADHMMKRALDPRQAGYVPAHPRTDRPKAVSRPLPSSHELLALQSYILQDGHNVLPSSTNTKRPLDANVVLGFEADEIALEELEKERASDVIVWYGGDGSDRAPREHLALLSALHGPHRKPTLLPIHGRQDRALLVDILTRLDLPLNRNPIVVIGNKAFVAGIDRLEEMRGSGQLEHMLSSIGWLSSQVEDPAKGKKKNGWKPKLAKWEKKEISEVERALKEANKKRRQ